MNLKRSNGFFFLNKILFAIPLLLFPACVFPSQIFKTIAFAGYDWDIKNSEFLVGPGPNFFSDSTDNVWVDSLGLHLKITYRNGKWYCAEVTLQDALGYGRYVFQVSSPIGNMDPNVVLGLFMWDNDVHPFHREFDIEFSHFGSLPTNAQYAVQPWESPGHSNTWFLPQTIDSSTHLFNWCCDQIEFLSAEGHQSTPPYNSVHQNWIYTYSDSTIVPNPGNEHVHMNLWLFDRVPPDSAAEVVISNFEFFPAEEDDRFAPFTLLQNAPNPFLTGTTIHYEIHTRGNVSLNVYDISGRLIKSLVDENLKTGTYCLNWTGFDDLGQEASPGIYFSRLEGSSFSTTKKMILIR
jgi:hypothetical protein